MATLHVGGQHRVGRCQDRAQQHASPQRQAQHVIGEGRDRRHGEGHGNGRQQDRRAPAAKVERDRHFDAGRKQGNQDRDFRQGFQQR